jgi:hypothetical protein
MGMSCSCAGSLTRQKTVDESEREDNRKQRWQARRIAEALMRPLGTSIPSVVNIAVLFSGACMRTGVEAGGGTGQ